MRQVELIQVSDAGKIFFKLWVYTPPSDFRENLERNIQSILKTENEVTVMSNFTKVPSEKEFELWLKDLIHLFKDDIEEILLTGSRAGNYARENSDWDVAVCLKNDDAEKEKEISFHPMLRMEGIEIYFIRGDGRLKIWHEIDDFIKSDEELDEFVKNCIENGSPIGDFNRFFKELKYNHECLYKSSWGCNPTK